MENEKRIHFYSIYSDDDWESLEWEMYRFYYKTFHNSINTITALILSYIPNMMGKF